MGLRELAWLSLSSGMALPAVAEVPAPETWAPRSRSAQTITGSVTIAPGQITFQNGAALQLSQPVQMLYRPEKGAKKVLAELYHITQPGNLAPESGGKLCGSKPVVYLIVWKAEKPGITADTRVIVAYSGPKFDPASPDECAQFIYDAGHR